MPELESKVSQLSSFIEKLRGEHIERCVWRELLGRHPASQSCLFGLSSRLVCCGSSTELALIFCSADRLEDQQHLFLSMKQDRDAQLARCAVLIGSSMLISC